MPPLVFAHVFIAYLGLTSGLIVMIMPNKGNMRHKRLGMFYFITMMLATLIAIYLSIQGNRIFLLCIGIFTFHSLLGGFLMINKRYTKYKWVFVPLGIIGLLNGAFMIYTQSMVLMIFGGLQFLLAVLDIKMLFNKNLHPLQIVKAHAGKMAGSFTAATTAFVVNVVFTGSEWWHWLLPTLIITPISIWWGIKLDRKRKMLLAKTANN